MESVTQWGGRDSAVVKRKDLTNSKEQRQWGSEAGDYETVVLWDNAAVRWDSREGRKKHSGTVEPWGRGTLGMWGSTVKPSCIEAVAKMQVTADSCLLQFCY